MPAMRPRRTPGDPLAATKYSGGETSGALAPAPARITFLLSILMERRYGSIKRAPRLPESADEDRVEARFEKGVLKATPPKKP